MNCKLAFGVQEYNAVFHVSRRKSVDSVRRWNLRFRNNIEDAKNKSSYVQSMYSTIGSGQSQVAVSLSRIERFSNYNGSKKPGIFHSSLATVYNALFLGGGPGKNESYRNIELIRNNKVYTKVDPIFWSMGISQKT
jgi:hypothetical protein